MMASKMNFAADRATQLNDDFDELSHLTGVFVSAREAHHKRASFLEHRPARIFENAHWTVFVWIIRASPPMGGVPG
jgi:hypothetical protein